MKKQGCAEDLHAWVVYQPAIAHVRAVTATACDAKSTSSACSCFVDRLYARLQASIRPVCEQVATAIAQSHRVRSRSRTCVLRNESLRLATARERLRTLPLCVCVGMAFTGRSKLAVRM